MAFNTKARDTLAQRKEIKQKLAEALGYSSWREYQIKNNKEMRRLL